MMKFLTPANFNEFDLVLLTESFATQSFDVEGFYSYHCLATKPSHGRPYGGVSLLVGPALKNPKLVLAEDDTIVLHSSVLTFVGMYSSGGRDSTEDLLEKIGRALAHTSDDLPVLLAGDLNCRLDEDPLSARTTAVMNMLAEHALWVCSDPGIPTYYADSGGPGTEPRRPGSSVIDIFAFGGSSDLIDFEGYPQGSIMMGLRKHLPVCVSLRLLAEPRTDLRPSRSREVDNRHLLASLVKRDPQELQTLSVNELAVYLTNTLVDATLPQRVSERRSPPWFDTACFRTRRQLLQLLKASPGCDDSKRSYCELRRSYRHLLRTRKELFAEKEEQQMIMRAQETPYKYLRRPVAFRSCPIPAEELQEHFRTMFQESSTVPDPSGSLASETVMLRALEPWERAILSDCQQTLLCSFSRDETSSAISALKNHKAFGNDLVRNEHLKEATQLGPLWVSLFNKCLTDGVKPDGWPDCTLKVIPKGKGDARSPSSWRGIAKKSCIYKTLSSMLANRLSDFLETTLALPPEQHGFRRDRSTATACAILLDEIKLSVGRKKLPLFAVFVDLKAAFDVAPRDRALEKLARLGVGEPFIKLLSSILQANRIFLDDGIRHHESFLQTTGYPQGDNLSPLLFLTLVSDLPAEIKELHPTVGLLMYADDIVLYSRIRRDLQASIRSLERYCLQNGLTINASKTKAMKFRNGGSIAKHDKLRLRDSPIEFVNHFCYLGIEFSTRGTCFGLHIAERVARSVTAMSSIPTPQRLSLETAMRLFDMKIGSVASYGIQLVWKDLTYAQLDKLDKVKATFLKRALGLPRNAKNRLTYALAGTLPFVEDLVTRFSLEVTPALTVFRQRYSEKMREVPSEFYNTAAMKDGRWKQPLQELRHLVTREAVHGFHHKLCSRSGFHAPAPDCTCRLCGQQCSLYHSNSCAASPGLKWLGNR